MSHLPALVKQLERTKLVSVPNQNSQEHCKELGNAAPTEEPMIFLKSGHWACLRLDRVSGLTCASSPCACTCVPYGLLLMLRAALHINVWSTVNWKSIDF